MAKEKNKSFVELKENKTNNQENIINPLEQYEYIEPKKKLPIKKILLVISIIITITLIIIFLKMINNYSEDINKKDLDKSNDNTTNNFNTLTTTTTTTQNQNDLITETLVCSSSFIENNLQFETIVTANFHNQKLRSDENLISITLLDETSRDDFNNYTTFLQMFILYSYADSDYEINSYPEESKYGLSIKTIYKEDTPSENNLSYDEGYETVKQKLIELGHTCN